MSRKLSGFSLRIIFDDSSLGTPTYYIPTIYVWAESACQVGIILYIKAHDFGYDKREL